MVRRVFDRAIIPIAWLSWFGAVILCVFPPDRPGGGPSAKSSWTLETWRGQVIFAVVFAPLGSILRYYVSSKLNHLSYSFPLGTFACNVFGTVVLGMVYDLQHAPLGQGVSSGIGGGLVGCQVMQGVIDGFCGSLAVVTTWAAEMVHLERRGYLYGLASITAAGSLLIAIMGSVKWALGFQDAVCALVTS
jgi:fluoride ion exporter CrcB/FEX